jgi:hypothetical protein
MSPPLGVQRAALCAAVIHPAREERCEDCERLAEELKNMNVSMIQVIFA